jgi:hypothetical protein
MKDPLPRLLAEAATLIAGRKRLSLSFNLISIQNRSFAEYSLVYLSDA